MPEQISSLIVSAPKGQRHLGIADRRAYNADEPKHPDVHDRGASVRGSSAYADGQSNTGKSWNIAKLCTKKWALLRRPQAELDGTSGLLRKIAVEHLLHAKDDVFEFCARQFEVLVLIVTWTWAFPWALVMAIHAAHDVVVSHMLHLH